MILTALLQLASKLKLKLGFNEEVSVQTQHAQEKADVHTTIV